MVDYHAILPEPLAAMPVPAELKRFRMPFLEPSFLENTTCSILRQTWADRLEDFYIQFTRFDIRSVCNIHASPARDHIAANLIYILQGNIAVREHDTDRPLARPEGAFYLRRIENKSSGFILDFGRPGIYQIIYISISEKKFASLQENGLLFQNRELLQSREIRLAGPWIKSMVLEMQDRREPNKDALGRYFLRRTQRFFDAFIRLYDTDSIQWRSLRPQEHMDHLKVYLQNNLGGNLTLQVLAEILHMDRDALRKMFQEKAGLPISKYIQQARIEKACKLLDTYLGRRSIEQIAEEVGYNSRSAFYKVFKEMMGRLPKQYIRDHGN